MKQKLKHAVLIGFFKESALIVVMGPMFVKHGVSEAATRDSSLLSLCHAYITSYFSYICSFNFIEGHQPHNTCNKCVLALKFIQSLGTHLFGPTVICHSVQFVKNSECTW